MTIDEDNEPFATVYASTPSEAAECWAQEYDCEGELLDDSIEVIINGVTFLEVAK